LHNWCGIGDGGINKEELINLIRNDKRFQKIKEQILLCDVLIIDECSILSKKMFETTEFICRSFRCGNRYFGGIQIILSQSNRACNISNFAVLGFL
jgi:chromosomal replication initiation ATPase DnaA